MYWKIRKQIFFDKAYDPMTLTGAMRDDIDYVREGVLVHSGYDSSGRPVLIHENFRLKAVHVKQDKNQVVSSSSRGVCVCVCGYVKGVSLLPVQLLTLAHLPLDFSLGLSLCICSCAPSFLACTESATIRLGHNGMVSLFSTVPRRTTWGRLNGKW